MLISGGGGGPSKKSRLRLGITVSDFNRRSERKLVDLLICYSFSIEANESRRLEVAALVSPSVSDEVK